MTNCGIPEWCWTRPQIDAKIATNAIGINWAICEGQKVDLIKLAKGEWPEDSTEQCGGEQEVRAKY